jgi:hypothetical protein
MLLRFILSVISLVYVAHVGMCPASAAELRQLLQNHDVACFLKGDGKSTSSCELVILNKSKQAQKVHIPAYQVFVPTSKNTQTMMSTRPAEVDLEPGKSAVSQIPTVCISPKHVPPPAEQPRAYLPAAQAGATIHKEIFKAATTLDTSNGLSTLPLPVGNRLQTIAQLAIWREIGKSTPEKEDDVTKETIKTTLLESAHVDPKNLTKRQNEQIDDGVAGIFAAVDLTLKNAHDTVALQKGDDAGAAQQGAARPLPENQPAGRGSGPYVLEDGTPVSDTTDGTGTRIIVFNDQQGNSHEIRIAEDGHALHQIKIAKSDMVCRSEYEIHIAADGSRTETEKGDGCRHTINYGPDGSQLSDTWDERVGTGSQPGTELWRTSVTTYQPDGTRSQEETTREVSGPGRKSQGSKQASSKPGQTIGRQGSTLKNGGMQQIEEPTLDLVRQPKDDSVLNYMDESLNLPARGSGESAWNYLFRICGHPDFRHIPTQDVERLMREISQRHPTQRVSQTERIVDERDPDSIVFLGKDQDGNTITEFRIFSNGSSLYLQTGWRIPLPSFMSAVRDNGKHELVGDSAERFELYDGRMLTLILGPGRTVVGWEIPRPRSQPNQANAPDGGGR